jgi:menaquinone-dependent protoporphyrinogen IX oxidase
VVYISASGATESYAHTIADVLRSHGHEVDVVDLKRERARDLSAYDNVVVGMGVRIGMVYRKGKQFLRRADLKGKRLAIFLSSGMAVEDAEEPKVKFLTPLVERHALDPIMYDAFPGKIPGSGGALDDRTDPEAAKRWAEQLADLLDDDG